MYTFKKLASIQYEGFIKEFLSNDNNFHNLNYGDYNANSEDYYNNGDYPPIDNDLFNNTFIDNEINNTWLNTTNNNEELQTTNSNLYTNEDYQNTESFAENLTESYSSENTSSTLKDNIYEEYNSSSSTTKFDITKEINNFMTEYSVFNTEENDNETSTSNSTELNGSDIPLTENIKHIVMCYERVCTSETQEGT